MLSQLTVKNLAVVERLDLSFEPGMSTVTGETGAGKSILLQALGLALGVRADSNLVRHGKEKADISAAFALEHNQTVQDFLSEHSLEDEGECILRRVITSDGRSKAFINGNSVPLSTVRNVGDLLLDIHGQNEHQLLLRPDQQMKLLDGFAQLESDKQALNEVVKAHKILSEKVNNLLNNQDIIEQQQALYLHQVEELNEAMLDQDELNTIESNFKTSANSQAINEKMSDVLNQLESETGANAQLLTLSSQLSEAFEMDNRLQAGVELLSSAQVQTQEAVYELTQYLSRLSTDGQSAQEMEERISELYSLGRKHQCQIEELIIVRDQLSIKLEDIGGGANSIDEMNDQLEVLVKQYQNKAQAFSKARHAKAGELSKLVTEAMQVLGMPGSEFKVGLNEKPDGVHLNGHESIEFLVTTNMGQEFKPLKKVASGGELSRISLAISVVSSDSEYTPTLIFDEVDVGISGAVAEVVGRKLQELAKNYQIICITHLAQVASFGHQHLRVSKVQNAQGAQTTVEQLKDEQRVDEVARILGGATITDKARVAAAEMITSSRVQ
ncbi:DNA repair protein RecN [Candidatus Thioglobus sp.]|nr:DNA repair protein RecN [Candidatus Thioglobus sp.]MDB3893226.1 DNA repair protein RecN [Candidatus Thioglobus sp.]MDB9829093.1 DNA repair protein RecN [Candidatus Thioglobus sp.]MDC0964983.1 DNA repair protein RecN [Candidatus Thioglobus sp.]MDC1165495.1 DNA repair protein RecN [Candidatus Thioglobus sp.]